MLTIREAIEYLKAKNFPITKTTLYNYIHTQKIVAYKGKFVVIPQSELDRISELKPIV